MWDDSSHSRRWPFLYCGRTMRRQLARSCCCLRRSAVATFLHKVRSSRDRRGISKREEDCRSGQRLFLTFYWQHGRNVRNLESPGMLIVAASGELKGLTAPLQSRQRQWTGGVCSTRKKRSTWGVCPHVSTRPIAQVGSMLLLRRHTTTNCLLSDINIRHLFYLLPNT